MQLIHEGVMQYNGGLRQAPAHCYVRIYLPESVEQRSAAEKSIGVIERPIIVACQMDSNKGKSITNKIELIGTIAWRELIPEPERWNYQGPIVIQHYHGKPVAPGRAPHRPETESFDWVEMQVIDQPLHQDPRYFHLNYARWLVKPQWSNIPRDELEQLLGQPFPPFPLSIDEANA